MSYVYEKYESDLEVVTSVLNETHPDSVWEARPGNNCVWVTKGRTDAYYFVKDDKILDVIFD